MLTSKQRAFLRAMGNQLESTFQIGKNGITDNIISQYDQYLTVKEIVKTNLLKNDDETPKDAANKIAVATGADVVSVTGRKFVIYRKSDKLTEEGMAIKLPRQ
ncbi:MAG: YhbY family RNA-binding protein [Saccharofermentanales bacterium]